MAPKTYVLVHGAFFGGWCWKNVAARLRERGHLVHTPTLTGLGERAHLLAARPTLETFIEDVAQVVRYEDLKDVILVGHSYAGSIVSALADRMPQVFRHLVYLDAQLLDSGQSPAGGAQPASIERYRRRIVETSSGPLIPALDPQSLGVTDPAMLEWIGQRISPHPFQTYFDELILKHPLGNGLPVTYVASISPEYPNVIPSHQRARDTKGWTYVELPTGHNAMLTMPDEVSELLAGID